jgi:hypothetical protein
MPDPRAALRLINIGCKVSFAKTRIEVPIEVKDYEDFVQGTRYPKMSKKRVWMVEVTIPFELMDDIKEGSIDLADQTIDLSEIQDAYDKDLDAPTNDEESGPETQQDENQMTDQDALSPDQPAQM